MIYRLNIDFPSYGVFLRNEVIEADGGVELITKLRDLAADYVRSGKAKHKLLRFGFIRNRVAKEIERKSIAELIKIVAEEWNSRTAAKINDFDMSRITSVSYFINKAIELGILSVDEPVFSLEQGDIPNGLKPLGD